MAKFLTLYMVDDMVMVGFKVWRRVDDPPYITNSAADPDLVFLFPRITYRRHALL